MHIPQIGPGDWVQWSDMKQDKWHPALCLGRNEDGSVALQVFSVVNKTNSGIYKRVRPVVHHVDVSAGENNRRRNGFWQLPEFARTMFENFSHTTKGASK